LFYRQRDHLKFAPDEPDKISFEFVSEELNGVNRDLRQAYDPARPITDQLGTVRTRVVEHFPSLWDAIFDTGVSRVFLGVHWSFDSFADRDVLASTRPNPDGTTAYKATADIRYKTLGPRGDRPGQLFPVGGVPLGIGIANDIVMNNLKPTPAAIQPSGREKCGDKRPPPRKQ
jgi:vanadium chloroperoxidase